MPQLPDLGFALLPRIHANNDSCLSFGLLLLTTSRRAAYVTSRQVYLLMQRVVVATAGIGNVQPASDAATAEGASPTGAQGAAFTCDQLWAGFAGHGLVHQLVRPAVPWESEREREGEGEGWREGEGGRRGRWRERLQAC